MNRDLGRRWLLPCDAMLPRSARRLVAEATSGLDRDLVETALLLTSEIVTNVLRYGEATTVSVSLTLTGEDLLVAAGDNVDELPHLREPAGLEERGRGLILLDALASDWGATRRGSGGKVVWFRLRRAPGSSAGLVA